MIGPGATIGILGGGQLGRMLALAAAGMGYRVHVLAPEDELPAGDVAALVTRAAYTDRAALDAFAASVDVATFEFENIDVAAIRHLEALIPVHPPSRALEVSQDRLAEKRFVEALGGVTAPYRDVASLIELEAAVAAIGCPAVLKTRRMGYDGKGQARLHDAGDCAAAWAATGGTPALLEGFVAFEAEFSVIIARGAGGSVVYAVPDNRHVDGVLDESHVPAAGRIAGQAEAAVALARRVADALDYRGVLTLEFFACEARPGVQRDGAARAQQRPLDDRGRARLAVREPYPRHLRPAARLARGHRGDDPHEEPARRARQRLAGDPRRSGRAPAPLRQERDQARPQDGPCYLARLTATAPARTATPGSRSTGWWCAPRRSR